MTVNESPKIGGLLLAAGGSSRLGRPKQLVLFNGQTLLRRAAKTLMQSACAPVVVVLGAETELSRVEIDDLPVTVCINSQWQTGMSSSIDVGLRALIEIEPDLAGVLITLCDQPHISTADIDRLTEEFQQKNAALVAAEYNETIGVPALFSREVFDELFDLKGDTGARHIIRNHEKISALRMDNAKFDIDTSEDLLQRPKGDLR